jgi:thiol-disulfide isomerase/thioredoxin
MARKNKIAVDNIPLGQIDGAAIDSSKWVDERLAFLTPHETWNPDFGFAQSRLQERLATPKRNWSRMIGWSAVLVTASLIVAIALTSAPTPRVLAQRCIDCSIAIWQTISPPTPQAANLDPVNQRRPAENFELKDANGALVRLSDLKGKVVVVNFWATWCGGCKTEIPWFVEFYNKYKDAGLEVVGVSLDEDGWKSVRPYLAQKPIPYHIALATDAMRDKLTTLPVTILIDREGRTALTQLGVPAKTTYQADIESLLK